MVEGTWPNARGQGPDAKTTNGASKASVLRGFMAMMAQEEPIAVKHNPVAQSCCTDGLPHNAYAASLANGFLPGAGSNW